MLNSAMAGKEITQPNELAVIDYSPEAMVVREGQLATRALREDSVDTQDLAVAQIVRKGERVETQPGLI